MHRTNLLLAVQSPPLCLPKHSVGVPFPEMETSLMITPRTITIVNSIIRHAPIGQFLIVLIPDIFRLQNEIKIGVEKPHGACKG